MYEYGGYDGCEEDDNISEFTINQHQPFAKRVRNPRRSRVQICRTGSYPSSNHKPRISLCQMNRTRSYPQSANDPQSLDLGIGTRHKMIKSGKPGKYHDSDDK